MIPCVCLLTILTGRIEKLRGEQDHRQEDAPEEEEKEEDPGQVMLMNAKIVDLDRKEDKPGQEGSKDQEDYKEEEPEAQLTDKSGYQEDQVRASKIGGQEIIPQQAPASLDPLVYLVKSSKDIMSES